MMTNLVPHSLYPPPLLPPPLCPTLTLSILPLQHLVHITMSGTYQWFCPRWCTQAHT